MVHRVECCRSFIEFVGEGSDVLQRIVTGDENWCFQFYPETKRRSFEWRGTNSPLQKKVRLQKSRVKTVLIGFFLLLTELSTASFFVKAPR
ncbi:hypothetical protein Cfor_02081 [Coptotermes formosanus]|uniref:Uncharacterized protein n=1 Tax=Coptotermes formosanus TaxID=36987 RepID=A0A6L2P9Q8_COPFO|nr:hypothetical protein Cfor_02081 [Coptotermes formosanus]